MIINYDESFNKLQTLQQFVMPHANQSPEPEVHVFEMEDCAPLPVPAGSGCLVPRWSMPCLLHYNYRCGWQMQMWLFFTQWSVI